MVVIGIVVVTITTVVVTAAVEVGARLVVVLVGAPHPTSEARTRHTTKTLRAIRANRPLHELS